MNANRDYSTIKMKDIRLKAELAKTVCTKSKLGESFVKIARSCGISETQVVEILAQKAELTSNEIRAIHQLKENGLSLPEISDEFGVDLSCLRKFLQKTQLPSGNQSRVLALRNKGRNYSEFSRDDEDILCPPKRTVLTELKLHEASVKKGKSAILTKPVSVMLSERPFVQPKHIYSYRQSTDQLFCTQLQNGSVKAVHLASFIFKIFSSWCELPSGDLVITGGQQLSTDVKLITRKRDFSVTSRAQMLAPRYCHFSIHCYGHLYVLGGYNGRASLSECERFSISKNRWETLDPLPTPSRCLSAVVIGLHLYALGGSVGADKYLDCIQKLNFEQLTWELLELKLPAPCLCIACFQVGAEQDKAYFVINKELYSFLPSEGQITSIKSLDNQISSRYGPSYYSDGMLYSSSTFGAAHSNELGNCYP